MNQTAPVVISRQIPASPERVFRAWTEPAMLAKWFFSAQYQKLAGFSADLRPGGAFKIVIEDPEDRFCAFGEYRRVEAPHLLEFTWQWEESSIEKGVGLVTVELSAHEDGTLLTLTHALLSSDESCKAHTQGWTSIIDRLFAFAADLASEVAG